MPPNTKPFGATIGRRQIRDLWQHGDGEEQMKRLKILVRYETVSDIYTLIIRKFRVARVNGRRALFGKNRRF